MPVLQVPAGEEGGLGGLLNLLKRGGGVTIFNILTISSVGIGIDGKMFKLKF